MRPTTPSVTEADATKREEFLELEPMQRELLEQLPDLQLLLEALKKSDLDDIVWMCVGGNPADYKNLRTKWSCQPDDIELVVALFVQDLISKALKNINTALTSNERLQALYDKFRENSEVPSAILKDMKLVRPSPDKVLREVNMLVLLAAMAAADTFLSLQMQQQLWYCAQVLLKFLLLTN
jgi:hypothetical protein